MTLKIASAILFLAALFLVALSYAAASPSLVVEATSANCVNRGSGDGLYTIAGQVTNKGSAPATLVQVIGLFYDDSGRLIVNATSGLTNPPSIAPGLSAGFALEVDCPGCALVSAYRLVATESAATSSTTST